MGFRRHNAILGVAGQKIKFRSPPRRNLAARLEPQFLAETFINPLLTNQKFRTRRQDELTHLANLAQYCPVSSVANEPHESGGREIARTASTLAEQAQREKENQEWSKRFLETYLHWLIREDKRPSRLQANVRRNTRMEDRTRRHMANRYHDLFFPQKHGFTEATQRRALSHSIGEVVIHRIVTSTKANIRRAMTNITTRRQRCRRKPMTELERSWPFKVEDWNYLTKFKDLNDLADGQGNVAFGNLQKPKKVTESLVNDSPLISIASNPNRNRSVMSSSLSPTNLAPKPPVRPPVGCWTHQNDGYFHRTFMRGLAERAAHQQLLRTERPEFIQDMKLALTAFSLADPPQKSLSSQRTVLYKYVEKWNRRVRRHLNVLPKKTPKFTLFDENVTDSTYFATKDVTTDFNPDMLFEKEKEKEKESLYKTMADNTAATLDLRRAYANWIRTSGADVRLTDFQEWSAFSLEAKSIGREQQKRRVEWINGPPYFGNGSATVKELQNQATCMVGNVQSLAKTMANHVTQSGVERKFVIKGETDLPAPGFYQSLPPWMDLTDASPFLNWKFAKKQEQKVQSLTNVAKAKSVVQLTLIESKM